MRPEQYRSIVDCVKLRADCLDPSERFNSRLPRKSRALCILTIRRLKDGGKFEDGEGVRLVLIAKALSFPKPDAQLCICIDLEDDFRAPVVGKKLVALELALFDLTITSMECQTVSMMLMRS